MSTNLSAETTPHAAPTRREWGAIALSALAATLLCVIFAEHRGLWVDEYITLRATGNAWSKMTSERLFNGHSPLYFFYAKLFLYLGDSERVLRLSSALMAGAAVVGTALLALEIGLRGHLKLLLLMAPLMPYWMEAGTLYRYMMTLIAIGSFCAWLAARMACRPSRRNGAALLACVLSLVWMHASSYFFLIPLLGWLVWEGWRATEGPNRGAAMLVRVWPILAGFAIGIPLLMLIMPSSGRILNDSSFDVPDFHRAFLKTGFGDAVLWPRLMRQSIKDYSWLLTAALAAWLAWGLRGLWREGSPRAARLLTVLLIGMPLCVGVGPLLRVGGAVCGLLLGAMPVGRRRCCRPRGID